MPTDEPRTDEDLVEGAQTGDRVALERLLEGESSAPVCEQVERHLAACPRCAERCATRAT